MNAQRLDALLKSFTTMDRGVAGCALTVSLKGKTAYEGYCGLSDVDSGRPIGPDSNCSGTVGEFSWAGAAGTLTLIDPAEQLALVYMQQQMPGNREETCHPLLRNVVYGLLD